MNSAAPGLTCFKAYDVRGRIPSELNPDIACRIGRAYAQQLEPGSVVVGHDVRHSSPELAAALVAGLRDAGVEVIDIGLCGTEQVYFSTWHLGAGGGIMVTASHNPADYNGMKFVREAARPVSGDSGLDEIRRLAEAGAGPAAGGGDYRRVDTLGDFVDYLLNWVDLDRLRPLKIVVNPGNGGAGLVIDALEPRLPFEFVKVNYAPDGDFPNGIPNPLLPDNRAATADAVRASGADLGIAWDGDFDRCFLFDETGEFIEGYYIVGLLARALLQREPGGRIIHDPRLVWNTREEVAAAGGIAVQSKTGHAFIKERMRAEDALYGGEMSAHHYFRDFAYCDSGMIPWLLVAGLLARSGQPLSAMIADRVQRFPVSGEINRRVRDAAATIAAVRAQYEAQARAVDETDGIGLDMGDWRFNLRMSNTEPVIRLNVEARGDRALMQARTQEILALVDALAG
ncbi:MAG: phosphomannomutase [Gammaproteobacteria bacterium]|nr:MAG: phosphomannomutase [Gammaproteobacteria bacterium]